MVMFIHLTDIKLQSFLLQISYDGTEVLSRSKVFEYDADEDCLIKIDESLQQLGKQSESVNQAIFGLNSGWIENGEVVEEKNPLLKKIAEELSLEPLGFIVDSEAIVQQKITGNSLFSGIITVLSDKNLTMTLIHQGKIKAVEHVGRSSDAKGDFHEGLARFSAKSVKDGFYLPTRIIIASMDLEEPKLRKQQQQIYDSDWSKQPQFLQPPTVEVMLGKEYESMLTKEAAKAVAMQKGMTQAAMAATIGSKEEETSSENPTATELDSEEMGFSDVDLDNKEEEAPTSFGVPISSKEFDKELDVDDSQDNLRKPDFQDDSDLAVELNAKKGVKEPAKTVDQVVDDFEPEEDLKKKKYKNFKLYILIGFFTGLIALVVIGFFTLTYVATAQVTIDVKTEAVSKELEITLDPNIDETDIEKSILKATKVLKSKKSESTIQTTGVTTVGEFAKGKVTIYNSTNAEKTFEKGTRLTTGDLVFELDEEVSVASESTKTRGETVDGKAEEVGVTALQIGADSNIKEDTELVVEPYDKSSYYAFVEDEDFTGGASREVKVVSESDAAELLIDLRKEIVKEINDEFEEETGEGEYVLPSNNIVFEEASYNYEIGNEADDLTLTLEIELQAIAYTASDLRPIATEVLASEVPENYRLADADPQILSAPTESDLDLLDAEKPVTLSANLSSFAIPEISEDSVKEQVLGKSIEEVKSLLGSRNDVDSVEVVVNPGIFGSIFKKVPDKLEKINITFINE